MHYTPDVYKIKLKLDTASDKNKDNDNGGDRVRNRDRGRDQFVIVATDGLWDFLEPQEAVDIVARVADSSHPEAVSEEGRKDYANIACHSLSAG